MTEEKKEAKPAKTKRRRKPDYSLSAFPGGKKALHEALHRSGQTHGGKKPQ